MRQPEPGHLRRDLVVGAAASVAALAIIGPRLAFGQRAPLRETADLIVGPFYPERKPLDTDVDMTRIRGHARGALGQRFRLRGRLLNLRGEPLANARIETWQANSNGRYAHPSDPNTGPLDPDFQGYAALRTDRDGRFAITTVKPGAYPTPRGDMRAPHMHFEIHGAVDRKTTQLFFPGEPLNAQDRHLNSVRRPDTVLAEIVSPANESVLLANWTIILTTG